MAMNFNSSIRTECYRTLQNFREGCSNLGPLARAVLVSRRRRRPLPPQPGPADRDRDGGPPGAWHTGASGSVRPGAQVPSHGTGKSASRTVQKACDSEDSEENLAIIILNGLGSNLGAGELSSRRGHRRLAVTRTPDGYEARREARMQLA
jgi:hypothetical protein